MSFNEVKAVKGLTFAPIPNQIPDKTISGVERTIKKYCSVISVPWGAWQLYNSSSNFCQKKQQIRTSRTKKQSDSDESNLLWIQMISCVIKHDLIIGIKYLTARVPNFCNYNLWSKNTRTSLKKTLEILKSYKSSKLYGFLK